MKIGLTFDKNERCCTNCKYLHENFNGSHCKKCVKDKYGNGTSRPNWTRKED